jgi:tRNA-dihydrouridine synthase
MLPTHSLLSENLQRSPFTKRREEEGSVIYQLVVTGRASLEKAVKRLISIDPFGIDVNLGCPAPMVSRKGGGKALFDDIPRLKEVLFTIRSLWDGPLSVKCRLGHETEQWKEKFCRRLDIFHETGVDALCVHPRFFHEKLKRTARWNLFHWIRSQTFIPLIGNGDITGARALHLLEERVCSGLMIGRATVERPWIFAELGGATLEIDYREIWDTFYHYTLEDFTPERALGKVKEFTTYFARNFLFGHELYRRVQPESDLMVIRKRVLEFLAADPKVAGYT